MPIETRAKRPGGRSARVRDAVFAAATELVAEVGADQVTVPAVAARAGVTASTIYRRWGTLSALFADIAADRIGQAPDPSGDLRGDLADHAAWTLAELSRPGGIAFFRAEVAADVDDRRAGLRECLRRVSDRFEAVLAAARSRGDHPPSLEAVLDRIVAPLYFRVVFSIPGTDEPYARRLAEELLDAPR
ncbi:TetR/AcrR family transcriptional regulator [Nocardia transvalensis]|uniref:TetR/AcrR family transcriptional regulator n=1 Tax=Nocardia transvalensis TaxID=37333 RepID=UPI001895EED4|nr:TetR/AcrR family transcriptional regulator [Nocardia transvalensis]MBF6334145.1 TetR/AcrR family transcriptional regulator [Nocardia transvalensis]